MGWDRQVKRTIYERQNHQCIMCGEFVPFNGSIVHHVKNKQYGGRETVENGVIRCPGCETKCHAIHPQGNPTYEEFFNARQNPLDTDHRWGDADSSTVRRPFSYRPRHVARRHVKNRQQSRRY